MQREARSRVAVAILAVLEDELRALRPLGLLELELVREGFERVARTTRDAREEVELITVPVAGVVFEAVARELFGVAAAAAAAAVLPVVLNLFVRALLQDSARRVERDVGDRDVVVVQLLLVVVVVQPERGVIERENAVDGAARVCALAS